LTGNKYSDGKKKIVMQCLLQCIDNEGGALFDSLEEHDLHFLVVMELVVLKFSVLLHEHELVVGNVSNT